MMLRSRSGRHFHLAGEGFLHNAADTQRSGPGTSGSDRANDGRIGITGVPRFPGGASGGRSRHHNMDIVLACTAASSAKAAVGLASALLRAGAILSIRNSRHSK